MSIQIASGGLRSLNRTASIPAFPFIMGMAVRVDTIVTEANEAYVAGLNNGSNFSSWNMVRVSRNAGDASTSARPTMTTLNDYPGGVGGIYTDATSFQYYVIEFTSASDCEVWVNNVSLETNVTDGGDQHDTLSFFDWTGAEGVGLVGAISAIKIWQGASRPSAETIYNERFYRNAQETTGLWSQKHCRTFTDDADGYQDSSGNGRHLTNTGAGTNFTTGAEPSFITGDDPGTTLEVQDCAHAHTADSLTFTDFGLAVADALHAHTADSTVLTQANTLVVQDALHGHEADNTVIEFEPPAGNLEVQEATHAHTTDGIALVQANTLVVQDALHLHTADSVVLSPHYDLVVADCAHAHAVNNISLLVNIVVTVDDAFVDQDSEFVVLDVESPSLTVADSAHAHTSETPTLTQSNVLAVNGASHGHTADSVALTQQHVLAVNGSLHQHLGEHITFGTPTVLLVVQEGTHAHTADNVALLQDFHIVVADSLHAQTSDNLDLSFADLLIIQDALHGHAADNLELAQAHLLVVQDALHAHPAQAINMILPRTGQAGSRRGWRRSRGWWWNVP